MREVTFEGIDIGCSRGILKHGAPRAAIVGESQGIVRLLLHRTHRRNAPTRGPLTNRGAMSQFLAIEWADSDLPSIALILRATQPCVIQGMGGIAVSPGK